MENRYSFIVGIILGIFLSIIVFLSIRLFNKDIITKPIIMSDTTYNTIILDSIKYNIKVEDSIIKNIRYEYEDSVIKVVGLNDSSSVELFKRLVSEP